MIDKMVDAIKAEVKAVAECDDIKGTFVLHTNFKNSGEITYTFPLIMLYMLDGPQSEPMIGGAHKEMWDFSIAVYWYDPNAYGVDESADYSQELAKPLDIVRRHFGSPNRLWLTTGMATLQGIDSYSFSMTYQGTHKAPPLKYQEGLALGNSIMLGSIAIDDEPDQVVVVPVPGVYVENDTVFPT